MAHMTREAMDKFRAKYRDGIDSGYSGLRHVTMVFTTGILVLGYAISQIQSPTMAEWWVLFATILFVNFAEYASHRWLGHIKTKIGAFFYQRHTGDHHSFFLERDMEYQNTRDWRVVFFPAYLIFAFLAAVVPIGYALHTFVSPNTAYMFVTGGIFGYLFYEVMHFSYHVKNGSAVEKVFLMIPGWKQMRHTHVLHHKRDVMHDANFNITLPIFDFLLGTLYWESIKEFEQKGLEAQR